MLRRDKSEEEEVTQESRGPGVEYGRCGPESRSPYGSKRGAGSSGHVRRADCDGRRAPLQVDGAPVRASVPGGRREPEARCYGESGDVSL